MKVYIISYNIISKDKYCMVYMQAVLKRDKHWDTAWETICGCCHTLQKHFI